VPVDVGVWFIGLVNIFVGQYFTINSPPLLLQLVRLYSLLSTISVHKKSTKLFFSTLKIGENPQKYRKINQSISKNSRR